MEGQILDLLAARRGHFLLESGHHGELWLDLDPLFVRPARLRGLAGALAARLAAHGADAICGPLIGGAFVAQLVAAELDVECYYTERGAAPQAGGLFTATYHLPAGLRGRVGGRAIAIVDDVINAGSATRATAAALRACGARPVALGALLTLGAGAASLAAELGMPLETLAARQRYLDAGGMPALRGGGAAGGAGRVVVGRQSSVVSRQGRRGGKRALRQERTPDD